MRSKIIIKKHENIKQKLIDYFDNKDNVQYKNNEDIENVIKFFTDKMSKTEDSKEYLMYFLYICNLRHMGGKE